MDKEIDIEGVIITDISVSDGDWLKDFIKWLEGRGEQFGGRVSG